MRPLADLLHEVLQIGDANGVTQVRRRHLPDAVMAELVKQTHEHALATRQETRRTAGSPSGEASSRGGATRGT